MTSRLAGMELQTWIEILTGIFVEGLLLGLLFYLISKKSEQNMKRHIQQHNDQLDKSFDDLKNELNTLQVMVSQKK
jgi:hypothetical protein